MPFITQLEQVLACLMFAFLIGDTIVRADMVFTSLRNKTPIHSYFKGWLSEKIFKDWYMFIGWERVISAFVMGALLALVNYRLLMTVFCIKVIMDFLFHTILKIYSNRFFK